MHISRIALAVAAASSLRLPATAAAYTAVGDRIFPATILLPQAAPGDTLYVTPSTVPVPGGDATDFDRYSRQDADRAFRDRDPERLQLDRSQRCF
jgi:hypothetical protein